MNLFVGLRGTKEELNLPANQLWAFTRPNDMCGLVRDYINRSKEDCFKDDIPLLFISFPSAKDPSYSERFPGTVAVKEVHDQIPSGSYSTQYRCGYCKASRNTVKGTMTVLYNYWMCSSLYHSSVRVPS